MANAPKGPEEVGTTNHPEGRVDIATVEMADLAAMREEMQPLPPSPIPRPALGGGRDAAA